MKFTIKTSALALVSAIALAAPALISQAWAGGITATEIVLGTHLDLSGPVAAGMPQLRNGTQMRFDEANEAGGVNGRKIRFIVEDNGSQPQMAVRAVDKLTKSDDVFALVNPFGSGPNVAAVKRTVDAGVIYFSPWGASALIQKSSGNSPLVFTTTPNYDGVTASGMTWMLDQFKSTKVGFIYQEGPFGELMRPGLLAALDAKGLKLVSEAGYKAGDIDFSSQVARMKAAGVETIMIATVTRETVGIMAEVKKSGMNDVKVLTASPGRTGIVMKLGGAQVEGLYGIGNWNIFAPGNEPAAAKAWVESYKKRFNLEPDENAMLAYAYADWFVTNGLAAAGKDITADKVVKSLQTTTYNHPIFYGPKKFINNHVDPEDVRIDQVKNGAWTSVSSTLVPLKK